MEEIEEANEDIIDIHLDIYQNPASVENTVDNTRP